MLAALHGWNRPGPWPSLDRLRLQEEFDRPGLLRRATCGRATLLAVQARPMVDTALGLVYADPAAWLNDEFRAWQGQGEGDG